MPPGRQDLARQLPVGLKPLRTIVAFQLSYMSRGTVDLRRCHSFNRMN